MSKSPSRPTHQTPGWPQGWKTVIHRGHLGSGRSENLVPGHGAFTRSDGKGPVLCVQSPGLLDKSAISADDPRRRALLERASSDYNYLVTLVVLLSTGAKKDQRLSLCRLVGATMKPGPVGRWGDNRIVTAQRNEVVKGANLLTAQGRDTKLPMVSSSENTREMRIPSQPRPAGRTRSIPCLGTGQ